MDTLGPLRRRGPPPVEHDQITGILDWSDAGQGDARYDIAVLTLGHRDHLTDVLTGYGAQLDRDVIRGWWSVRSLFGFRWLTAHGFDPGIELDLLKLS